MVLVGKKMGPFLFPGWSQGLGGLVRMVWDSKAGVMAAELVHLTSYLNSKPCSTKTPTSTKYIDVCSQHALS